jgi:hypothetical protein
VGLFDSSISAILLLLLLLFLFYFVFGDDDVHESGLFLLHELR